MSVLGLCALATRPGRVARQRWRDLRDPRRRRARHRRY